MEALYNRAKLLEHGAQSPGIPMASATTIQHTQTQYCTTPRTICQFLSLHVMSCSHYSLAKLTFKQNAT